MKNFTLSLIAIFIAAVSSAQIINPGFESGTDLGWTENSITFGTPLCDAGCGVCGGPCVPQDGSWYCWFGGTTAAETGSVSQIITIPNGTTGSITFYVKIASEGEGLASDNIVVSIDGNVVFSVNAAEAANYADYVMVEVDITAYTDGASHGFFVGGTQTGGSNILFDSFNMTVDGTDYVGFSEIMNREMDVTVYPNPADQLVNLQFNNLVNGNATIRVYDINGKLISQDMITEITNKMFTMGTANLNSGIYTVEVSNGSNIYRSKFSVQH